MSHFKTLIISVFTFFSFLQVSEAARCKARSPSLSISPLQVSFLAGQSAVVQLSIRNNDQGCSATTFSLSASQSASISATPALSQVRLSSGQSLSTQMTVSSSVAGSYQVLVSLADRDGVAPSHSSVSSSLSVSVSAVQQPPPPPSYSLVISSPISGATVSGNVQIAGTASGFLNVEIMSSSGTVLGRSTPSSTGAFSALINSASLSNGLQTLTIMAWDSLPGQPFTQRAVASLNLNVQNAVTTTTTLPPPTTTTTTTTTTTVPANVIYQDGTARLNAMLNSSLNVVIPAGTYMITGPLAIRNGHVISAAASAQVILKAVSTYSGSIISSFDQQYTVRGLIFDGNYSQRLALEGNQGASLVNVTGSSNVTFENNTFRYAPSFGIWTYRSALMQIRGNTFLENFHAIRMDGANLQSGVIENNTFTNTAAFKSIQHLEAIGTLNLVIRGNTMAGAGLQEPTNHGYEGTWGNSIYIWNSTGHLVENNKVYKNYWSALVSGAGATHGIIRNNYLSDGTFGANSMWVEQPGAGYITVDSNELDGGVLVGDGGGDHFIFTNNIVRSRVQGLDVSFSAKDVLIQGNKFYSKAGYRYNNGIYLWEKNTPDVNVRVYNNHFEGFDIGIMINNWQGVGTVYGITLSGNTFLNNNRNIYVPPSIILNQPLGQTQ